MCYRHSSAEYFEREYQHVYCVSHFYLCRHFCLHYWHYSMLSDNRITQYIFSLVEYIFRAMGRSCRVDHSWRVHIVRKIDWWEWLVHPPVRKSFITHRGLWMCRIILPQPRSAPIYATLKQLRPIYTEYFPDVFRLNYTAILALLTTLD